MIRTKTIHKPDGDKVVIEEYNDATRQWEVTPGEYDDEAAADKEIYDQWCRGLYNQE